MQALKAKLRHSSLTFGLKRIAEKIFHQWLDNAATTFSFSEQFIEQIKDDDMTPALTEQLLEALHLLVSTKTEQDKAKPSWSFGFVCGHIEGSLEVTWVNKYVIQHSKEYRDLLKLLALKNVLMSDKAVINNVHEMYQHLLQNSATNPLVQSMPSTNVINIGQHQKTNQARLNLFESEMDTFLTESITSLHISLLSSKEEACNLNVIDHISEAQLIEIVGQEHFN